MKLIDLVSAYKGTARFDVNSVAEDESTDVVVFLSGEEGAIKDSVTGAEVVRFCVSAVKDAVPTLSVSIKPASEPVTPPESENQGGETL